MNTTIQEKMNYQIQAEMFSSNLYLSMSSWATEKGYKGISHWMKMQAMEEHMHAMKFIGFIEDRGGKVDIRAIEQPEKKWNGVLDIFDAVLTHEKKVTSLINSLYDIALQEKDHASTSFLQWFIDEQVEEEATVSELIDEIKLAGESGPGFYMIDKELSQRPPVSGLPVANEK